MMDDMMKILDGRRDAEEFDRSNPNLTLDEASVEFEPPSERFETTPATTQPLPSHYPVSQLASQPINQSAQSTSQPVNQSASQPVSQSTSQPVNQPASNPKHSPTHPNTMPRTHYPTSISWRGGTKRRNLFGSGE